MSQIVDSTIAYIYKEIRLSCGLLYPIKILPYIFKSIARYVTAYFPIINERMCYGSRTGYSTAVAMILFVIILIPVLISMRLTRAKN